MGVLRILSNKISDATADGIAWLTGSVGPSDVVQVANLDTANNPPALDEDGNLNAVVLVRKGTAAEIDSIVLKDGELAIIEDGSGLPTALRAGDGTTVGGTKVGSRTGSIFLGTPPTISSTALDTDSLVAGVEVPVNAGDVVTADFSMLIRVQGSPVTAPNIELRWRLFDSLGDYYLVADCSGTIGYAVTSALGNFVAPVATKALYTKITCDLYSGTSTHVYNVTGRLQAIATQDGSLKLDAWKTVAVSTSPVLYYLRLKWRLD